MLKTNQNKQKNPVIYENYFFSIFSVISLKFPYLSYKYQ